MIWGVIEIKMAKKENQVEEIVKFITNINNNLTIDWFFGTRFAIYKIEAKFPTDFVFIMINFELVS